jgi:hypothetical protein
MLTLTLELSSGYSDLALTFHEITPGLEFMQYPG